MDVSKNQELNQQDSVITLQQKIQKSNFKNPEISYNSNKNYALCTERSQENKLASKIDFFIYDLKNNQVVEEGSIVGNVYWENDYTVALAPYVGIVPKKDHIPFDDKDDGKNSVLSIKKIHLKK
ncbi:MAG: hypothetical protein ACK5MD_08355 [Flavobacteriales bacterium]